MHDFPQHGRFADLASDGEVIGSMGVSSATGKRRPSGDRRGVSKKTRGPVSAVGGGRAFGPRDSGIMLIGSRRRGLAREAQGIWLRRI